MSQTPDRWANIVAELNNIPNNTRASAMPAAPAPNSIVRVTNQTPGRSPRRPMTRRMRNWLKRKFTRKARNATNRSYKNITNKRIVKNLNSITLAAVNLSGSVANATIESAYNLWNTAVRQAQSLNCQEYANISTTQILKTVVEGYNNMIVELNNSFINLRKAIVAGNKYHSHPYWNRLIEFKQTTRDAENAIRKCKGVYENKQRELNAVNSRIRMANLERRAAALRKP